MALVSPGIQISVTDQSNYVPSINGTVPFILLATAENKSAPGGGVASGTTATNAGKLYAITSQRDLVTTFGSPTFQTSASGAAINGSEQNEYGLLAAYSALGVSNQVYVQRASVDLSQLEGTSIRPSGTPASGAHWLDTVSSNTGLYIWDREASTFTEVRPLVDTTTTGANAPSTLTGAVGNYMFTAATTPMAVWYKNYQNTWVVVGSTAWQTSIPAVTGTVVSPVISENSVITINTVSVTLPQYSDASAVTAAINTALASAGASGVVARVVNNKVTLAISQESSSTDTTSDGRMAIASVSGSALADLGIAAGSYTGVAVQYSPYYSQPAWYSFDTDTTRPSGSIWIKTTAIGGGTRLAVKVFNATNNQWASATVNNYDNNGVATYNNDPVNGGLNIPVGTIWALYDYTGTNTAAWQLWYRKGFGDTKITGATIALNSVVGGSFTFETTQPTFDGFRTSDSVVINANTTPAEFVEKLQLLHVPNIQVALDNNGRVVITHERGGDIRFSNIEGDALTKMGITPSATNVYVTGRGTGTNQLVGSNWAPLSVLGYSVSNSQPYASPADGTLWYWSSPTNVDVLINDGTAWKGYRTVAKDIRGYDLTATDVNGVLIQSSPPTTQSDGVTTPVYGDLWLDTSDLENFPKLYRRQRANGVDTWVLIDNNDNVSQNGIIFADARWATSGDVDPVFGAIPSAREMVLSNYLDLDAPDPSIYPRGTLLFNTRASSYNVKKYVENYFTESANPNEVLPAYKDTWISVSGFRGGSVVPNFGRHAQRSVVVSSLKAAIDSSTALREEQNTFNLIACPGYPELIPNMVNLNNDRNNTGFVIGDSPMRLAANSTEIIAWAQNSNGETQTNERGLTTHDPYLAVYYPACQTSDLSGNNVVAPASHAMIRAFIRSDNASYPWFAPAGAIRGLLDNINSVGYIDSNSGAFVSIGVTQGLRDTLYNNQINPLTYLQGTGLVCYGNKTTATSPSALDRVNVARLVNYIRAQLDRLARPYIFEPNDPITRTQIKSITESLLNDIVAKRGVSDYLVVCDSSNNTPDRVARNELYVDVAIQPTKSVEFIYIPIRLKNPGELESGNIAPAQTVGTGA